eukprot:s1247_g3.t1
MRFSTVELVPSVFVLPIILSHTHAHENRKKTMLRLKNRLPFRPPICQEYIRVRGFSKPWLLTSNIQTLAGDQRPTYLELGFLTPICWAQKNPCVLVVSKSDKAPKNSAAEHRARFLSEPEMLLDFLDPSTKRRRVILTLAN